MASRRLDKIELRWKAFMQCCKEIPVQKYS